jgi:hypothetical protein
MSLASCTIHFTKKTGRVVYASPLLLNHLQLNSGTSINLILGQKSARVALKRVKKTGRHLYIPLNIRNELNIPAAGQCFALNRRGGEIKLGPLVGIMSSVQSLGGTRQPGGQIDYVRSLLKAAKNKGIYFVFSPQDINWQQNTVKGYFYGKGGKWQAKTVSLPDVVYNRHPSRKTEKTAYMKSLKERLQMKQIPIFNWSYFDKWDIYHLLQGESEAISHIPESYIDPSPDQIRMMLEKHRFIYLKPTGGSLGFGIYRLTYSPQRGYFARYRQNVKNVLLRFSKFTELMRLLNRQKGKRLRNHVAQQGIRLLELDKCPIDFRFHLNKNGRNQWVVSAVGAKKAGRGSVTTHVRTGGQLMTPEYVLKHIFGEQKAAEILQNAKQTAIKLAQAIERNYPYLIGELGMDIGIDKKGKVWMFEANAKPGRSIFKHPELKPLGYKSMDYIFQYCAYLSRFHITDAEAD